MCDYDIKYDKNHLCTHQLRLNNCSEATIGESRFTLLLFYVIILKYFRIYKKYFFLFKKNVLFLIQSQLFKKLLSLDIKNLMCKYFKLKLKNVVIY